MFGIFQTMKQSFLTFDDGPTPQITEWTLTQLKKFNVKATFFVLAIMLENILKSCIRQYKMGIPSETTLTII